jgi:hypothetical protein
MKKLSLEEVVRQINIEPQFDVIDKIITQTSNHKLIHQIVTEIKDQVHIQIWDQFINTNFFIEE